MAPLRLLAMCLVPLLLRVGFAKPVLSSAPPLQARQDSRPVPAVPNGCDMVKAIVFDPADVVTDVYAEIAFYSIAGDVDNPFTCDGTTCNVAINSTPVSPLNKAWSVDSLSPTPYMDAVLAQLPQYDASQWEWIGIDGANETWTPPAPPDLQGIDYHGSCNIPHDGYQLANSSLNASIYTTVKYLQYRVAQACIKGGKAVSYVSSLTIDFFSPVEIQPGNNYTCRNTSDLAGGSWVSWWEHPPRSQYNLTGFFPPGSGTTNTSTGTPTQVPVLKPTS